MNYTIDSALKELGVSEHLMAHDYIKTAVELRANDTVPKNEGVMQLYYAVAEKHHVTYKIVERNIRYAIACAFNQVNPEVLGKWFGSAVSKKTGRATNGQFIEVIVKAITQGRHL